MESTQSTARLRSLCWTDLQEQSTAVIAHLLDLCKHDGFFYLEIDDDRCPLAEAVRYLLQFTQRLFDLPLEEKSRFPFQTTGRGGCLGYKALGTETGAFGTRDGFELFMLPYNELILRDYQFELVGPGLIKAEKDLIARHTKEYHRAGLLILGLLSQALELPEDKYLASSHDSQTPNTSSMTFLKYTDCMDDGEGGHVAHTDIGTLTFLHATADGLQVHDPNTNQWLWVAPRKDSLVVNVGDSLRLLTHRKLKSCLHRVVPHPSVRGQNRLSFAYFMRPNEHAILELTDELSCKSVEWHRRKLEVFGAPLAVQSEQHSVLLGKF